MQTLLIVIILLSLIGIYINLGTVSNLTRPEFKEKNDDNLPPDNTENEITKENEEQPFDKMGNSLEVGDGFTTDKKLINLNVTKSPAPDVRPDKWMTRSNREIGRYGLTENNLSYKNNFPYKIGDLDNVTAEETLTSKIDILGRNPKGEAYVSQIISPQDDSRFVNGYKFINRAIDIAKNQASNNHKILLDMRKIDPDRINERIQTKNGNVKYDDMEIKVNPDILTVQSAREHADAKRVILKHDTRDHKINQMKNIYNFK
jgi:hypothetical protein